MHKLIIVDDEKIVRNGLRDTVNWRNYGFIVVGTARNGIEAVEIIKKKSPEVVLTDIKMPEMDGISLAKVIKDTYPEVKTVLLSAYNDFKYAQDALKYNVRAYLLKPLKEIEIQEAFCALNEEINKENQLKKSNPYEREHILRNLISGSGIENMHKLTNILKNLNIFEHSRIAMCSVDIKKTDQPHDLIKDFILERACSYSAYKELSIISYMNKLVIIITAPRLIGKEDVQKILLDFKQYIIKEIENNFPSEISCVFGVGNIYTGIEKVQQSYSEALYAYNYKYFENNKDIIFFQGLHGNVINEANQKKLDSILDNLIDYIFHNDRNEINLHIRNYFEAINKRERFSIEEIRNKCMEIVFAIDLKLREKKLDSISFNKKELINRIKSIETYEGLVNWFEVKTLEVSEQIKSNTMDNTNWLIKNAKEYVNKHYNEKITLEDMARLCHTNPSYFSFRFKKVTGENFSDFVTRIKIEKSKDLLLYSEYKMTEIAEMVGFDDYSYFGKVFKKYQGMTPLKFRTKAISPE